MPTNYAKMRKPTGQVTVIKSIYQRLLIWTQIYIYRNVGKYRNKPSQADHMENTLNLREVIWDISRNGERTNWAEVITENFIFLNLDNKCRTEFEMNVTREAVVVDIGGAGGGIWDQQDDMHCNYDTKQRQPSKTLFFSFLFFFSERSVIWLLQPKHSESLLVVWQTEMQFNCMKLFIYEYDKKRNSQPPTSISSAASTAKSLQWNHCLCLWESKTVWDKRSPETRHLYTLLTARLGWGADCSLAIKSGGKNLILRM